jgi:hypothetical protein
MKDLLMGGKNEKQEQAAIRDPKNNELICAPEEIKRVTLEYCVNNLKKKEPEEDEKAERERREKLHNMRMEDDDDEGFKIGKDDFNEVLEKFGKKTSKAYNLILKADDKFQEAIFHLCKLFIDKEDFPDKFRKTILHMVKKKNGLAEVLKQNRFIHMKEYLARTCESLVVGKIKRPIFDQSSIYQIGGQARHSLEEHVFTLKSLIGLMEFLGQGLILTLVDIISFFDREDIIDVMETMASMKINKKAYRLWFKLNEKTEISVKTALGMTDTAVVGALVGQGSSGAAIASQAMVDMGLKECFAGSSDEMYYGKVRVESAAFQDDICKPNSNTIAAQIGMTRLSYMLSKRGLEAHEDKTGYIVFGNHKYRRERKQEMEVMPLTFGSFQVKEKVQDKYLGQVLHREGLAKSVEATILDRKGKIKGAIYLTKQVIETIQMQAIGGMMAAKQLWERAIVPSLLHGAGTWVGISPEAEKMCEELQELFWRVMLQVPRSTPKVMLTSETQSMRMKQRIWKQKVMTARSIRQKEGSLAKAIYEEQLEMGWPGLATEVEKIY